MKDKLSVLAVVLAAIALIVAFVHPQTISSSKKETSFERVVRTGTIRCGYALWFPEMMKDPNTGKLSGYDYDIVNAMGNALGLKVDWVEEFNWGVAEQGLITGRYDVACNSFWVHPPRAKGAVFSTPFIYVPLFPVVRTALKGPENSYEWLNDSKYKIYIFSGTIGEIVAQERFPKAKVLDAMTLTTDGDALMDISTGKADFSFSNWTTAKRFLDQNPNKIKILPTMVEVTNGTLLLPSDDFRMKTMVDVALKHLIDVGIVEKILTQYMGKDPRAWLLPASGYVSR